MTKENDFITKELLSSGELPVCDRTEEFLRLLRSTEEYHNNVIQRLEKVPQLAEMIYLSSDESSPPTYEEAAMLFEYLDTFEGVFWDFAESVIHLKYEPNHYSEKFRETFDDYRSKAKLSFTVAEMGCYTKETVMELDRIRSSAHNQAAQILAEDGIVETDTLGRMLVRAFLVDVKEDYFSSARQASFIRKLREAPDELAQKRLLMEAPPIEYTGSFSPERITAIQMDYMANNPLAPVVQAYEFRMKPTHLIKASRILNEMHK